MSDSESSDHPTLHIAHDLVSPDSEDQDGGAALRRSPRLKLPPMYTLLRAKREGTTKYRWTGHIYDISASGMRFELDQPLEPGERLEVRGMLPGSQHTTFRAAGCVVRLHDPADEAPGPVRMGMSFDHFQTESDARRLTDYLTHRGLAA